MTSSLKSFDMPRESIEWADEALRECEEAATSFFRSGFAFVDGMDPDTGYHVYKVVQTADMPHTLRRKATEALAHTKNAFDQAVYAAHQEIGAPLHDRIYFPWARNPINLQERMQRERVPPALRPIIEAAEPYPEDPSYTGGSNLIRAVAELANAKHTVGIGVGCSIDSVYYPMIGVHWASHMRRHVPPKFDPVKKEMLILEVIGEAVVDFDVKHISWRLLLQGFPKLQGGDLLFSLARLLGKAMEVVDDLEAGCISSRGGL